MGVHKGLTLARDHQRCRLCLLAGDILPHLIGILNPFGCLAVQLPLVRQLHPPDGELVRRIPNLAETHIPRQKPLCVRGPWPQDEVLREGEDLLSLTCFCSLKTVPANGEMSVLGGGL